MVEMLDGSLIQLSKSILSNYREQSSFPKGRAATKKQDPCSQVAYENTNRYNLKFRPAAGLSEPKPACWCLWPQSHFCPRAP